MEVVTIKGEKYIYINNYRENKEARNSFNELSEGEDSLFVMKGKENIFNKSKSMFPTLSHA